MKAQAAGGSLQATVVVIGAGVIGLTCALKVQSRLQREKGTAKVEILMVAREWPASFPGSPKIHSVDYASMWAGAHVRPIPASTPQLKREARWLKRSCAEFAAISEKEPWAGLTRVRGAEYLEAPSKAYLDLNEETFASEAGLPGYRQLDKTELPEGVSFGYEYETFCINSPVYCLHLLRKFILRGGKTLSRDMRAEKEAFYLRPNVLFVINASGTGFGDPKCFPTRGHTLATNVTGVTKTITRQNRDGSWSFVIPRFFEGGTIIGGTKEPDNWDTEAHASAHDRLLEMGLENLPLALEGRSTTPDEISVIADIIGRRPTRDGGLRLEVEEQELGDHVDIKTVGKVIHAYGAGGRGFELSCGIGDDVADLADLLINGAKTMKPKL